MSKISHSFLGVSAQRMPRRNLTIYAADHPIMERLRNSLESASDSESVRHALRAFETLIANEQHGITTFIEYDTNTARATLPVFV